MQWLKSIIHNFFYPIVDEGATFSVRLGRLKRSKPKLNQIPVNAQHTQRELLEMLLTKYGVGSKEQAYHSVPDTSDYQTEWG